MWVNLFIVLATWFGLYFFVALLAGVAVGVGVAIDMRGKWSKLTVWKWAAVVAIFIGYALWHGLLWPRYAWQQHKRDRENSAYVRSTYAQMMRRQRIS